MRDTHSTRKAIYIKFGSMDAIVDPHGQMSTEAVARIVGLPASTWWRIVSHGGRVSERAIVAIVEGMAEAAKRVGRPAPGLDDLFEIRAVQSEDRSAA